MLPDVARSNQNIFHYAVFMLDSFFVIVGIDPVPAMLGDSIDGTTWTVFLTALEATDYIFTWRRNALAALPAFLQLLGVLACLFLLLPGPHYDSTTAAIVLLFSIVVSTGTHYLGLGDEVWAQRFGFDAVLQSFLAQWQTRLAPLELKIHALPASRRSHRRVWFCSLALPPKPLEVRGDKQLFLVLLLAK